MVSWSAYNQDLTIPQSFPLLAFLCHYSCLCCHAAGRKAKICTLQLGKLIIQVLDGGLRARCRVGETGLRAKERLHQPFCRSLGIHTLKADKWLTCIGSIKAFADLSSLYTQDKYFALINILKIGIMRLVLMSSCVWVPCWQTYFLFAFSRHKYLCPVG